MIRSPALKESPKYWRNSWIMVRKVVGQQRLTSGQKKARNFRVLIAHLAQQLSR
jgi:hypothetical protein